MPKYKEYTGETRNFQRAPDISGDAEEKNFRKR